MIPALFWPGTAVTDKTWGMLEWEFRFMDMSHAGLEGPENGLWSVVLTTVDATSESWSILGLLILICGSGMGQKSAETLLRDVISHPTHPPQLPFKSADCDE